MEDGRRGLLGLGIFLLIVPSLVLGPEFNGECLGMWWHRMVSPFVVQGATSAQEINQSMVGVLTRLLTETKVGDRALRLHMEVNIVSWARRMCELAGQGAFTRAAWDCWRSSAGPRPDAATIRGCSASSPWSC